MPRVFKDKLISGLRQTDYGFIYVDQKQLVKILQRIVIIVKKMGIQNRGKGSKRMAEKRIDREWTGWQKKMKNHFLFLTGEQLSLGVAPNERDLLAGIFRNLHSMRYSRVDRAAAMIGKKPLKNRTDLPYFSKETGFQLASNGQSSRHPRNRSAFLKDAVEMFMFGTKSKSFVPADIMVVCSPTMAATALTEEILQLGFGPSDLGFNDRKGLHSAILEAGEKYKREDDLLVEFRAYQDRAIAFAEGRGISGMFNIFQFYDSESKRQKES